MGKKEKQILYKGGKPYNPYICERCGNEIQRNQKVCPYCKLTRDKRRF